MGCRQPDRRPAGGPGIGTVRELAEAPEAPLVEEFGPTIGPHIGRLGRGVSSAIVDDTPWVPRAHGRETTYQRDLTTPEDIAAALRALADQVVEDIGKDGRACARVALKVRFAPFFTYNRIRKLPEPTFDPVVITRTALDLLDALDDTRPIRLLGVRAEMVPPRAVTRTSGARDPLSDAARKVPVEGIAHRRGPGAEGSRESSVQCRRRVENATSRASTRQRG